MKYVISVDRILDWNMHMLVKQSILQDISKSKKLNLTQEMIDEAKAESKKLLHSLLISKLPEKREMKGYNVMPGYNNNVEGFNQAVDDMHRVIDELFGGAVLEEES